MRSSVFTYFEDMQDIDSNIFSLVQQEINNYNEKDYSSKDVMLALSAKRASIENLKALLSSAAEEYLEDIARKSQNLTKQYFGNSTYLFTPLYLSNYCSSKCVYCGFKEGNDILRAKLSEAEIHEEMQAIKQSGLEDILMLTGEGRNYASVEYIAKACKIAREYFKAVGVEVYPMNVSEYELLHENGCDFVTIFQETYNPIQYGKIHIGGEKRVMPYRFNGQERALKAGMRGVAFGSLLGIDDFRKDALACALHAHFLQQKYPHAEISLSVPRLRPIINNSRINPRDVSESRLLQVMCAYRIFLPYANITLSSRESKRFRDNALNLGATKLSAGVKAGIGQHNGGHKGDEQFVINDERSVEEMIKAIKSAGRVPVMSETIYLKVESKC